MKTIIGQEFFKGQNWLIIPVAFAVDEPRPSNVYDQTWLLVLTGVVETDVEGNSTHQWLHETLSFAPSLEAPLNFAIDRHSIPRPPTPLALLLLSNSWVYRLMISFLVYCPYGDQRQEIDTRGTAPRCAAP
jgi:hypothetical protein